MLSFVLDYSGRIHDEIKDVMYIKRAIIRVIERCTEPEDRAYLYAPDRLDIPQKKGGMLPHLSAYRPYDLDVGEAVRQALYLAALEDDYRRYVILVTDRYDKKFNYEIQKVQRFDLNEFWDATFLLCGVGDRYDRSLELLETSHPRTIYWHCERPQDFEPKIVTFIKNLTGKVEKDGERYVPDEG